MEKYIECEIRELKEETAKDFLCSYEECFGILNETIRVVQAECDETTFVNYRRRVGRVMGELYLELTRPIEQRFPHLRK